MQIVNLEGIFKMVQFLRNVHVYLRLQLVLYMNV